MIRLKGRVGWYKFLSLILGILLLAGGAGLPAFAAGSAAVLYEGPVALPPGESFTVKAYSSGAEYPVDWDTPLGALQAAGEAGGFSYEVTDKNYAASGALLLDNVGKYTRDNPGRWYAYVNDVHKDGFNNPDGALNLIKLAAGDRVEFYYADGVANPEDLAAVKAAATAVVKTVVAGEGEADAATGATPAPDAATGATPAQEEPAPSPIQAAGWTLKLSGETTATITQEEFEEGLACPNSGHRQEWTDAEGNVWAGMPLWLLAGWVDDQIPHEFNAHQATAGYTILVKAADGYTKDFASQDVAWSNDYIIANECNGKPLTDAWPLRLVGDGVAVDGKLGGRSVGNVVEIALTSFETAQQVPELRIVKYGEDGKTIIAEKTVDYKWMEANLEVIGDGKTVYKFEGITNDPNDVWDPAETYPGGFKIANAVKGTRIRDLCELVGGMGAGTETVLVAKDGYETRLPYSSIYTDPSVQERQGDAILAWWADGKYVPDYVDGMRLFFTPGGDNVYGQWDMHETLPEQYWHYYYGDGVQYPSCAGLATKWITELRVYSIPLGDWTLELDGTALGGLEYDVSKTYFEQALACQFGANHKASYTDDKGRVWEGMPLWFLAGFVDDQDLHSDNAFNDELARAGYQVVLTAADGYTVTINSADIIRNNDYIVANTLNGDPIPEDSSDWPLRLVGPAVKGGTSISQLARIELVPAGGLTDIAGHWAEEFIRELVALEAISGYPDGTFKPDNKISRAEFVSILVKAFGLEGQGDKVFADTAGHWAQEAIATAAQQGIASGYDANTFGPNAPVTREQMATMLVKAAGLEPWPGELYFADSDQVSGWAREAVVTAVHHAIIAGYPDNTFRPQGNATRAEAATVVVKALAAK
jgi:DMSO/TMAO reductase YedYZ molybdopterin-dependent catalytic subunit